MPLASPEIYRDAALSALAPDPEETMSEWADTYMRLAAGENAEPGRWRTSRFPFTKKILDSLSPLNPVREVNYMKPVQMSGTSVVTVWAGHTVDRAPCNMLIVQPTIDFGRLFSKQRLDQMINMVPEVRSKLRSLRARNTGNNIMEKEFLGGRIVVTGANSGTGLRFMSAKHLALDECDAYPYSIDNEGRPSDIAEKRTATFPRYKIFRLSTPLMKETSVIEPAYLDSDRQKYFMPCPYCDHGQHLELESLTWPKGKPEQAAYLCNQCRQLMPEHKKPQMLEHGEWLTTLAIGDWEKLDGTKAGFHINLLYQPYGMRYSWPQLAKEWTALNKTGDLAKRQAYYNLYLAETWEEELGEKHSYSDLWNRREIYPAPVPKDVKVITAFADVQHDRLEVEARGFGAGKESWGLAFRVILGSPADKTKDGPWAKLDEWFQQAFIHEALGPMRITLMGVDSGDGNFTKEVYDFIRPRQGRGVMATKGSNQPKAHLLAGRSKHKETGILLHSIGTDAAKDSIYANLKLTEPGPGYFHWPQHITAYDQEYFEQVCAEVKIPVKVRGRVVGSRYKKHRSRNEALDLLVGNWFMVELTGVDLNQYAFDYRDPNPNQVQRDTSAQKNNWVGGQRAGDSAGRSRGGWLKR